MEGGLHAGHHHIIQWMGWDVHLDTIITTWIVFAIIIGILMLATRNCSIVPGPIQNAVEMILEALMSQFKQSLGNRAAQMSAVLFTFFLFILMSNEIGLLPNPDGLIKSPTSDINTTFGLALATMAVVWVMGIKTKGIGFFGHFFKPFTPFVVINAIEECAKPITLAFRLFGNILAGEILLELLYKLAPYGTPMIWIVFSIVIGIIQAFIFTLLSAAYIGMGVNDDH